MQRCRGTVRLARYIANYPTRKANAVQIKHTIYLVHNLSMLA